MGCCGYFTCSRNALISLNILYLVISFILIGVAAYAKAISIVSSLTIIGAIIGCGVFLLLIACMGFIGTVKHHQICLFFYMVILFLLFLVQFSLAIALLAITTESQQALIETGWKKASADTRQDLMISTNCCDLHDWTKKDNLTCPHDGTRTVECCEGSHKQARCCGGTNEIIACPCSSCFNALSSLSNTACKVTGCVGLVISFSEIFGVVMTVRYRSQRNPLSNADRLYSPELTGKELELWGHPNSINSKFYRSRLRVNFVGLWEFGCRYGLGIKRTLEQIQMHFSDDKLGFTSMQRKIWKDNDTIL